MRHNGHVWLGFSVSNPFRVFVLLVVCSSSSSSLITMSRGFFRCGRADDDDDEDDWVEGDGVATYNDAHEPQRQRCIHGANR
jgi:hypothetical protein